MKQSVIWDRHTDFISNRQEILLWEFNIRDLQRAYEVEIYSLPVEIELFRSLRAIAASGNKQVRERSFTIFMGDCGPGFELFAVGVQAKTSSRVTDLITACFENIRFPLFHATGMTTALCLNTQVIILWQGRGDLMML
jgi:hypothetical protein